MNNAEIRLKVKTAMETLIKKCPIRTNAGFEKKNRNDKDILKDEFLYNLNKRKFLSNLTLWTLIAISVILN